MVGKFIISLDFELHWGRFDRIALDAAGRKYFSTTRELIPQVLEKFKDKNIRATWATVGFLFAKNLQQQKDYFPEKRPRYANAKFNSYGLFERNEVGENENSDPFHFAPTLIEKILATPGQELASHTFSHYYCLEPGQDAEAFRQDMFAGQAIAKDNFGVSLTSVVFPRNQFTADYLSVLKTVGITAARSNPDIWFWNASSREKETKFTKAFRLVDHYLPLDGETSFLPAVKNELVALVPASRFFRPFHPKIDGIGGQWLKVRRIKDEMTNAAKTGRCYHLWWHPHNLATDPQKNLAALDEILTHFQHLRNRWGMESAAMKDV